jgi:nicotinate-nucleotide adenylyltransferase
MRLGIFGGTFDPIHVGHLIIAQEAASKAGLDMVWFVPTGQPWMKARSRISAPNHRMEMARLAVDKDPHFKVSSIEVDRLGPSYTVDTLTALRDGDAKGASLFFILGMDSLETLHLWHQSQLLFDLCSIVAVSRPGHGDFGHASLDEVRPGVSEEIVFVEGPNIGVSGAEIRRRVFQGLPITHWAPRPVEEYIYDKGLYKEAPCE